MSSIKESICKPDFDNSNSPRISGVAVLYFPEEECLLEDGTKVHCRDIAKELSAMIRCGSVLCLPSSRYWGNDNDPPKWDFRIEGGQPEQVVVKRSDSDIPTISEYIRVDLNAVQKTASE